MIDTIEGTTKDGVPYISLEWPRRVLVLVALGVIANYLLWRLYTFNPHAPVLSFLLYCAELFGVMTLLLHSFMNWRLSVREAPPPAAGLSVDVFIPTINEPLSVVRRTALTAVAMDYPHSTWILDDGRRPELRVMAEELGCGYIARENNTHAKAGNLNHALAHTSGEFIAVFDADHAPKRNFLLRTLGYFRDPQVAFVQTPQDFYNLDSYQHRSQIRQGRLWTEQSLFFRVIQRGKDVWNAAFFCGSCAVIRRSSLESIGGGFATGTVTEDLHTSLKLHKQGYSSVYHAEPLAFGIAPAHIEAFIRQRVRWGQGAMQVWRKERILTSRSLTVPQKICYFASVITYFDGWQKGLYYLMPALVLLTGWVPLQAQMGDFAAHFAPYLLMSLWASNELGRGYCRVLIIEQYNMARFAAFAYATLGLFRRHLRFRVTNKHLTGLALHSAYLLPQYSVFLINVVGIPIGTLLYYHSHRISSFAFSINIVWAMANIGLAITVLAFTLHRVHFRRQDYRFAIPLVAQFPVGGQEIVAAVEDISSAGMRLVAERGCGVVPEQVITGQLHLPGEIIPFRVIARAVMHSATQKHLISIGCQFTWPDHASRQRLELFLYGSDLEWQVHHLSERMPTLIERILQPFCHWHEIDQRPLYGNAYATRRPMLYTPG
ncbi:MAG: glycosyltransferase, partial [Alphaproteobacteria bacterium]|nr:glycosyltransferase [Alphaproteobacteria bacterium]